MPSLKPTNRFKRDYKRAVKDPLKNMGDLMVVLDCLQKGETLAAKYKDHLLMGNYRGHRECHIYPDWLLIYQPFPEDDEIVLVRLGSHSELFNN